jgi:hypothetical protein
MSSFEKTAKSAVTTAKTIYAMQRANGDWFGQKQNGRVRVPLFLSHREAMRLRSYDTDLLVFKPVLLDLQLVGDLVPDKGQLIDFLLVESESTSLKHGRIVDHSELMSMVNGSHEEVKK